jgi:hypothetical protein
VKSKWAVLGISVGVSFVGLFLFFLFCLNHVHINEIGVAYNSMNGKVLIQDSPGWYATSPFVQVVTLSTLAHQVSIPSGAVVINTKIVRFKREGVEEFIRLQGFSYSLSQSLDNILMGYAFSGKEYPFLEVMQEAGPEKMNMTPLPKKQ